MKAIIEREDTFTITINGVKFANMKLVSEWEGFKKFSNPSIGTLILSTDQATLEELLGRVFYSNAPNEMDLVKASPNIVAKIKTAEAGDA